MKRIKTILAQIKESPLQLRLLLLIVLISGGAIIFLGVQSYTVSIKFSRTKSNDTVVVGSNKTAIAAKHVMSFGIVPSAIASAPITERVAALKQIKRDGFSEVRVNFNWSVMEPIQGKYDWAGTDTFLKEINDAGLKTIIQIDHVPAWNRPSICKTDPNCAPIKTDEYGTFAAAAAARYQKYGIIAYEIWNEQNNVSFWKPFPNPNQYAHLLSSANAAIKKIDPKAVVLVGGLSGDTVDRWGSSYVDPRTYLAQIYAAGAKPSFDGVAYHPYIKGLSLPDVEDESNGWTKMTTGKGNIREIMVANGDAAKAVWITEFGIPTGGKGGESTDVSKVASNGADHVSYDSQAQITKAVLDEANKYDWIKDFILYNYQDNPDASRNTQSSYGILQQNGEPKPVLDVIKTAIQ